jgi:hypothetical protein
MTFSVTANSTMTLRPMTHSITTQGIMTISQTKFNKATSPQILTTSSISALGEMLLQHNDTQRNALQHNDTQQNALYHNDTQHYETHHYDTQHNEIYYKDIQHNNREHN